MKAFTKPAHAWWKNGVAAMQSDEGKMKRMAALKNSAALKRHLLTSASAMHTSEAKSRRMVAQQARVKTPEERFWPKVNKTDGCWEWNASLLKTGYGNFSLGTKKPIKAHRCSWILHHGPIPFGLCVCHKCDNRKCIRPDHLFLGTVAENNEDGRNKGRIKRRIWSKLNEQNVAEIRSGDSSKSRCQQLAIKFGVSWGIVYRVAKRKIWRDQP